MAFLGNALDFERFNLKSIFEKLKSHPQRLLVGAVDPLGTKIANTVLGTEWDPAVNQLGGATEQTFQQAQDQGIDTGPGRTLHGVAGAIAGLYGGNAALGALGKAGLSLGGGGAGGVPDLSAIDPNFGAAPQAPQAPQAQPQQRRGLDPRFTDLGLALLANSGYSTTPRTFGQTIGASALQAQQMAQERSKEDLQSQYMQAQIAALNRKPGQSNLGAYQPGDYTPDSWAKFVKSGDPAELVRYTNPRQEYSPSYQNVTRTLPDGSTQQGTFNTRTGEYDWLGAVVPPGTKARVEATGKAEGEASGGQAAKTPAKASFDYVANQFDKALDSTPQGGPLGISGRVGGLVDYGDARRFDNLREQLSTELRTLFRIPGEGTLSDREQAQYGVQLPDRTNPTEVNRAILEDLRQRVNLRLETPVNAPSKSQGTAKTPKRVKVDAQGNVIP